jgi:hypothetical protein
MSLKETQRLKGKTSNRQQSPPKYCREQRPKVPFSLVLLLFFVVALDGFLFVSKTPNRPEALQSEPWFSPFLHHA